ncbi:hypothetical protein [Corynebacterium aquatimens]|nr:hypothetical protein [Corynebacterium aquatimens]
MEAPVAAAARSTPRGAAGAGHPGTICVEADVDGAGKEIVAV